MWAKVDEDPVRLLGEIAPSRLDALATDSEFLARLEASAADLDHYLTRPAWYQIRRERDAALPEGIAYFSMEFGVTEVLPNYSGGLGILAGDHLKAASDLGLPLIGVGLLYRSGYFKQSLSADGWQLEHYPSYDRKACRCACSRSPTVRPRSSASMCPAPHPRCAGMDRAGGSRAAAAARLRHREQR